MKIKKFVKKTVNRYNRRLDKNAAKIYQGNNTIDYETAFEYITIAQLARIYM
ncbi:MAG: hypothetical protein LC122_14120 [Chitinophagales bacterium]|nr:hypothetical protein [Chitinophagales bacterium]